MDRSISHFQLTNLFNNACLKAATPSNAIGSFKIHPFHPEVFEDWEFATFSTTDRVLELTNDDSQPIVE